MEIKKANTSFKIEDLLNGKLRREDFQIDYLPMYQMLDNLDRKIQGGLASMSAKDIWERIYDFGVIGVSLNKADMQTRIDQLNEQNLKWHTRAMDLEAQVEQLKINLQEKQSTKEN